MKQFVLLIVILLAAVLPAAPTVRAADAGWTRVGEVVAADLAVTRDHAGLLEVWTADTVGFSVFRADGSLRAGLRWPTSAGLPSGWTYRVAPVGSSGAVYTIGGCCPAKSRPTFDVMLPSTDRTRYVDLAAAFDIGRGGASPYTVAVDLLDRPWVAVGTAVWMMEHGASTPLIAADDRWIEVTRAGSQRAGITQSIAAGPDGSMWLLGRDDDNRGRLLQYHVGETIAQVGEFGLAAPTPDVKQIMFDAAGTFHVVGAEAIWRLSPNGTFSFVIGSSAFGAEIIDAVFVGETLWVATGAGVYRHSTTPSGTSDVTTFGLTERVGDYQIVPAAGISWIDPNSLLAADPAGYWHRTDLPVVHNHVGRSFFWGPAPWEAMREPYRNAPYGTRRVFYYDKARMEITNPAQPLVTNGLLVVEMVTGQLQLGDAQFSGGTPAWEAVAGDPAHGGPGATTYASYAKVLSTQAGQYAQRIGGDVTATLASDGTLGDERQLARPETRIAAYNTVTGHNIPRVFHDFLNQSGLVYSRRDGMSALVNERVIDPLVAMGHPVTEPYWVRAQVGGVEKWVLTQLFERRVLTYTPDNPEGWRVEMGNVGQHYYAWRYGDRPWERVR